MNDRMSNRINLGTCLTYYTIRIWQRKKTVCIERYNLGLLVYIEKVFSSEILTENTILNIILVYLLTGGFFWLFGSPFYLF